MTQPIRRSNCITTYWANKRCELNTEGMHAIRAKMLVLIGLQLLLSTVSLQCNYRSFKYIIII